MTGTGYIQGQDAILAFFKDNWVPFVCSTDISLALSSTKVPIRAPGDGHWKKFTYQDLSYTITLSGLLKFDDVNWTGWDMIDNQLNFSHVLVRCSFLDDQGNVRTLQGYVMIETSTLGISPGALVKNDFQLQSNGKLDMFDGYVPCPSAITSITVIEAMAGVPTVSYTYTGSIYQIKYRLNNTGDYVYVAADLGLGIQTLPVGNYNIEIIPVCLNGYEGAGLTKDFAIAQGLTCTSVITAITVNTTSGVKITNTHTGAATQMKYRIDGGIWVYVPIGTVISLPTLPVGAHTVQEIPICANNVEGTGTTQSFTVASQPSQSLLQYSMAGAPPGTLYIYVNGVLTVTLSSNITSGITVPNGALIKAVLDDNRGFKFMRLKTTNTTTTIVLDNQTAPAPDILQYIFTTNGNNFLIAATFT